MNRRFELSAGSDHPTFRNAMKDLLPVSGAMPSRRRSSPEQRTTNEVASPFPKHNIGCTARQRPHPPFLAVLLGLFSTVLCSNGVGALGLATHDAVAPRHALRANALCAAAHHAALGIEAALVELDGDLERSAVLRDEAEASLEALEAEWHETAAWIDRAREQLTLASTRMAGITNQHAGATGVFATFVCRVFSQSKRRSQYSVCACRWLRARRVEARLLFSCEPWMHNHTESCTYLHRIPALSGGLER